MYKNNSIHVTQRFTDTIYDYISETNQLKAKYILDYNKKKIPESYLRAATQSEFRNSVSQNDYFFFLGKYNHNGSHNIFYLNNRHKGLQTIVYRDDKSGNLRGGTNADYNINEIPPIAFPRTAAGEYFVSIYYPNGKEPFISNSAIISGEDKQRLKSLTINDNPVLVFFKLKNF